MIQRAAEDVEFIERFDRSLLSIHEKSVFRGRVTRVFLHAAWVESSGRLLTLLDQSRGLVPFGLVLSCKIPPIGSPVHIDGRKVSVGEAPKKTRAAPRRGERGHVFLLKGVGMNLDLKSRLDTPDERIMREQTGRLFELLPDEGKVFLKRPENACSLSNDFSAGLGDELENRAAFYVTALSEILTQGRFRDEKELRHACRRLHGLGCGLTPTGDDLLVAVAACCCRLAENRVENGGASTADMDAAFRKCLKELCSQETTKAGSEMIDWAAQGFFPEPVVNLMRRIGSTCFTISELEQAAADLLDMGGRSGRDLLCGMIIFMREFLRMGQRF